jgi:hypothetical protein
MAIGQQVVARDADLGTNLLDWQLLRLTGDLDITLVAHDLVPECEKTMIDVEAPLLLQI